MHLKRAIFFLILLLTIFIVPLSIAQSDGIILKAQQPWESFGVGSTCISGSSNLFVADIDGDGSTEIITGGSMYTIVNGSRGVGQAPLMIWNWNGENITLELSYKWPGSIRAIYAADLNGDGQVELITAGTFRNDTGSFSTVRVWHWDNKDLILMGSYDGLTVSALFVNDLDKDGISELLSVGRLVKDNKTTAQLTLWHFNDNLGIVESLDLDSANVTNANSLYAGDFDDNGQVEIAIGGYSDNLNNSKGQVTVWNWAGNNFSLKANKQWQIGGEGYALTIAGGVQGNTIVNNVKAGDLDGDGKDELVAGGFAWDGSFVKAQIKVFAWDGENLLEKDNQEWVGDYLTEVKCLSIFDVNGDGKVELISSGTVAAAGSFKNGTSTPDRGQLRIWSWKNDVLNLDVDKVWTLEDGACAWNVAAFNLDKNGAPQMVTVGCVGINSLCDPNMRIWEVPQASAFSGWFVLLLVGLVLGVLAVFLVLFSIKKRKKGAIP